MALASEPGIEVVGTAGDGLEAAQLIIFEHPTVLIIDANLVSSSLLFSATNGMATSTRVVALGIPDASDQIIACAERGVAACVPPDASVCELVQVLHQIERNEVRVSPNVSASLMRRVAELAGSVRLSSDTEGKQLTERQCEIVELLDQGLMNKEIARRLGLSLSTVKNHVHNALEELGLTNRQELARWYRSAYRAHVSGTRSSNAQSSSRPDGWQDLDELPRDIAVGPPREGTWVTSSGHSLGLVDASRP